MDGKDLAKLKAMINRILAEDLGPSFSVAKPKATPPPLPAAARKAAPAPASAALPQKGALNKFKADVNMAVDAASRVKAAVDAADTKEALRWLDKVIGFATSAKSVLGVK